MGCWLAQSWMGGISPELRRVVGIQGEDFGWLRFRLPHSHVGFSSLGWGSDNVLPARIQKMACNCRTERSRRCLGKVNDGRLLGSWSSHFRRKRVRVCAMSRHLVWMRVYTGLGPRRLLWRVGLLLHSPRYHCERGSRLCLLSNIAGLARDKLLGRSVPPDGSCGWTRVF